MSLFAIGMYRSLFEAYTLSIGDKVIVADYLLHPLIDINFIDRSVQPVLLRDEFIELWIVFYGEPAISEMIGCRGVNKINWLINLQIAHEIPPGLPILRRSYDRRIVWGAENPSGNIIADEKSRATPPVRVIVDRCRIAPCVY